MKQVVAGRNDDVVAAPRCLRRIEKDEVRVSELILIDDSLMVLNAK
jgi:hypothetical protein